jgi:hypothetical protein
VGVCGGERIGDLCDEARDRPSAVDRGRGGAGDTPSLCAIAMNSWPAWSPIVDGGDVR